MGKGGREEEMEGRKEGAPGVNPACVVLMESSVMTREPLRMAICCGSYHSSSAVAQ